MSEDYSQLDSFEESIFIFENYLKAVSITIAAIMLFSLYHQKNKIENRKSFQFAISSIIFTLLLSLTSLICQNDLLFAWKYDDEQLSFVSMVDSIEAILYILGKISFYCSFTYYVLSVFDSNNTMKKYLKIWMIIVCFILLCMGIGYAIYDASEETLKEIGVTSKHHIHLAMAASHEGSEVAHLILFITVIIDVMYFAVLLYSYIKEIKSKTRQNVGNKNEIKAVVLLVWACLIFWILLILTGIGSPFRWPMAPIDMISDDICLFLMFEQQTKIYQIWCQRCDVCCFKCVFGSNGYETTNIDDSDHDSDI